MYTKGEWRAWRFSRFHNWKVSRGEGDQTFIDLGLEGEADARLIAAAPDTYEALKECVDYFRQEIITQYMKDETIPYFEGYKRGVIALAKAEVERESGSRPLNSPVCFGANRIRKEDDSND